VGVMFVTFCIMLCRFTLGYDFKGKFLTVIVIRGVTNERIYKITLEA